MTDLKVGQIYFDRRYSDFFSLSRPVAPVINDNEFAEYNEADFKEYILNPWYRANRERWIMNYNSGRVDTCQTNWLVYHIENKQYSLKIA